jgi:hypothetical protein
MGIDRQLDAELRSLGRRVDFPPTPDLAAAVGSRLARDARGTLAGPEPAPSMTEATPDRHGPMPIPIDRGRARPYRIRRSAFAAVAAILLLAGVVAAVTYALGGWRLSFVDRLPTAAPTATAGVTAAGSTPSGGSPRLSSSPALVPTPGPVGSTLGLGQLVELDAAAANVDFTPLAPPAVVELGRPDAVYVDRVPTGGMVSYVYATREGYPETSVGSGVGLIVTQFRGDLARGEYFRKLATTGTIVTRTQVDRGAAYYLSGPMHAFLYRPPDGREAAEERFRLVGDALIWERGLLTLRLEGDLTLEQARLVAESID